MKRFAFIVATVVLTAVSSGFSQEYRKQNWALRSLPRDIKFTEIEDPTIDELRASIDSIRREREQQRAELAKLAGPSKLVAGEFVRFTYAWPVTATQKDDPSKVLNDVYMRKTTFRFVDGDGNHSAELKLPTGQVVTMSRPQNGAAPAGGMVTLAVFNAVKGLPKSVIKNRLCAPSKIETGQDGKERWYFHKDVIETKRTVQNTMSTTNGYIGQDGVNLNTIQTTPVTLTRTVALWDFTLVFDEKGFVERMEQGSIGAGEWKKVAAP